ncbi:cytochrome c oxidase subunit II [Hugenholtzia roseola]|uniref:cytochrome c oxidase subunit II n=1 Tax=Hugenholtzia roseola TaxID=1002 RepID=UPI00041505C4|nr:cytochrome c oxidase subunit II [Hugenholtzia roseola]
MYPILVAFIGILFVVLMALVYRVFTLVKIAKSSELSPAEKEQRVSTSNKVNGLLFIAFFFVLFGSIAWYSIAAQDKYMLPDAASAHGGDIDFLFWVTTGVVAFVFFLTHALLFFFPYIYRFREERKAEFISHNNTLEVIWTAVPAVVLTILVVSGWSVWSEVTAPAPEDAMEIEIVGKQFNWRARYGGADGIVGKFDYRKIDDVNELGIDFSDKNNYDDFMASTLKMPVGKNVLLKIRSKDVLHSVFLPHFRVKMDAVPGMPTKFWFTPTKTTADMRRELEAKNDPRAAEFKYQLACTEICGGGHFAMAMDVEVVTAEEFDKWYKEQKSWAEANADYLKEKGIDVPATQLAARN